MIDFTSIFTQDKIVDCLNRGCKVELVLIQGQLTASVMKDNDPVLTIPIHELNTVYDFTEYSFKNFRRSKLEKEVEIHDNVGLNADKINLLYCTSNLTTETAELNQLVIRNFFFNKKLDIIKTISECSDVFWYISMIMKLKEFSLTKILKANVVKLKIRYPTKEIKLSQKNEELENLEIEKIMNS